MNQVSESFITAFAEEAFAHDDWRVFAHRREQSVIRNRETGKRSASIIPDLVLSDRHQHVPFDCKHKLYGGDRMLSTSDIYRSVVYAYALSASNEAGA